MRNPDGGPEKSSFWNTLPGLLTAIAALITAIGGLVTFYYSRPQNVQPEHKTIASVPLDEGKYELQEINGAPQKRGIIMRVSKVTDDSFLADTTTPTPYAWNGKLLRKGDGWDLVIVSRTGPQIPREGTAFNPGSGFNSVMRQGPLVTFRGGYGTFVWRIVED